MMFGKTRIPPRDGCLAKVSNRCKSTLVREVTQNLRSFVEMEKTYRRTTNIATLCWSVLRLWGRVITHEHVQFAKKQINKHLKASQTVWIKQLSGLMNLKFISEGNEQKTIAEVVLHSFYSTFKNHRGAAETHKYSL